MKKPPRTLQISYKQLDELENMLDRELERLDDLHAFFKMMELQADQASQGGQDGQSVSIWQGQRALYSYLSRFMLSIAHGVREVDGQLLEHLAAHEDTE